MFVSALIKNRRYRPKFVKGGEVKAHFSYLEVSAVNLWPSQLDGVMFHVSCMKELDYVMSLMTTYGTTDIMGNARPRVYEIDGVNQRKTISYPEVVYNHCQFKDAVDTNNGMRMSSLSLE